jgi:hypothetical protein
MTTPEKNKHVAFERALIFLGGVTAGGALLYLFKDWFGRGK